MTEKQIVEGCIRRDINAQKQLYEMYAGQMLSVCIRYVGDKNKANDLLHDGFIRLFDKINKFSGTGSLGGWIRKMFINLCLEYLRNTKNATGKQSEIKDNMPLVDDISVDVYDKISADELMDCVRSLPVQYRKIFNLYAIEGYSHEEIAQMLDISDATSRSDYYRARILLQEKLKLLR